VSSEKGSYFYDLPIEREAEAFKDLINSECTLHAFVNDYFPTLLSVPSDFVEPTFDGYTPLGMTGAVTEILKAGPSRFVFTSIAQHWDILSDTGEVCYGIFITAGSEMVMAVRLDVPLSLPSGFVLNTRIRVVVGQLQVISLP